MKLEVIRMKKTLIISLIMMILISVLASCTQNNSPSISSATTAVTTSEPAPEIKSINVEAISSYTVIYPDGSATDVYKSVSRLVKAIEDATGVKLARRVDYVKKPEEINKNEFEILVGNTNREASGQLRGKLRSDDYGFEIIGNRIVITGITDENTIKAVDEFIEKITKLSQNNAGYFISDKETYLVNKKYEKDVFVNGKELHDYSIVCGDDLPDIYAEYMAKSVSERYNYVIPISKDNVTEDNAFYFKIDSSNEENAYTVECRDGSLYFSAGSGIALYSAINCVLDEIETAENGRVEVTIDKKTGVSKEIIMNTRVMSFNIRCAEFTSERIDLVIKMIETYKPSSVGFQEATDAWVETLASRIGNEYAYVSCGRDANRKGEATPIFYLKSRYNLIESGTKWMSETPDVAGSKVPESSLPRIFTYVVLEEIGTGGKYTHINTHLEHTSDEARIKQMKILFEYLKEFDAKGISYVLTGDFNCDPESSTYKSIIEYGLSDSCDISKTAEKGATFHGYGKTSSVIDFIFVQSERTEVDFYRACTETFFYEDGSVAYPSDHNPVIIDAKISG